MASSSFYHQQNAELDLFIGIGPQIKRRRLCGSLKLYDVFINRRGPDVKETRAKIIPVFYDVKPSDLRYIQKCPYAHAFAKYEEKGRNLDKLERWKECLLSASVIKGYEFSKHKNDNNDHCKNIARAVLKEVQHKKPLHVADHSDERVQHFESYCRLKEREGENFNIIGIFGMGGMGKIILAKELFKKKRSQYDGTCFLTHVREAHDRTELPSLQSKLLKGLISRLKHRLESAGFLSFLIVLDDIDNMKQLDALLVRD